MIDRPRLRMTGVSKRFPGTLALDGVDVAYYLIHALGTRGFERTDRENARRFGDAARAASHRPQALVIDFHCRTRSAIRSARCPSSAPSRMLKSPGSARQ